MSIRTKLTLWYSAILAVVLLLFGIAVYAVMSYTLIASVDNNLQDISVAIEQQNSDLIDRGDRTLIAPKLDLAIASIAFVQISNAQGALITANTDGSGELLKALAAVGGKLDGNAFAIALAQPVNQKRSLLSSVLIKGLPPMRVYTGALLNTSNAGRDQPVRGYLQVAQPIEDIERAKRGLLLTLLMVGTIGLVLSAAAGVAMAQRALQPVDSITRTVVEIYRADDLEQRVQVASNDEVGRLGGAFNEMLERLQSLFRTQQRLVADVSHELRTPLTVIRGNTELMRSIGFADRESLDAIIKESDRMTRMVSNLLLLSQADVGALPMKIRRLDLTDIVLDVERSANTLSAGRIDIVASACGDLMVQGDPDRIKQVLLNLVDNAIKHTPEGGKVTIAADCIDGQKIKLSVSDSGMGIPQADVPHVFERFYRVDKARSRDMGGAGLGLAIVKSIVDAHGGKIEVQSAVGQGTTFVVWLPAYEPNVV